MKNIDDLVGEKVIVRSNEDEPIVVGTIIGWQQLGDTEFPLVKYDGSDKECICFSVILPYNEKLHELFTELSPTDGWELARDISLVTQICTRKAFPR